MNILYQIFISPIEAVMHLVLSATYSAIGDWGISLFILSLCVNLILLPLYHFAEKWQQAERRAQSQLQPKLREFQQTFSGEERFLMIRTLYRQAGYHPIYALRTSLGFLVQVPFFIAGYHLLSHYQPLQGVSFFIFEDLGKPDALLWGIHLMPFVMTVVNLLSAFVYTQKLRVNEKIQVWLIAVLFLVVLYNSSSALLIYWTFNNLFSFAKNIGYARLNSTPKMTFRREEPTIATFQKQRTTSPGSEATHDQIRRDTILLSQKIFQSPYVLALLVGVYPVLFYISNNWFMFQASQSLFIFGTFSLIIFMVLSSYYVVLSWVGRKLFTQNPARIIQRLFVLGSILVLAFLLRNTFSPMVDNQLFLFLIVMLIASTLAWFIPKIQILRVNIVLVIMCVFHLGSGLYSITTTGSNKLAGILGYELNRELYEQVTFSKTPNVYYIVPDGYPNRDALESIFDIDDTDFFHQLKSLGFMMYPLTFSNYRSTTSSISSTFGLGHHYYQGRVGNFELLHARKFIVSGQNPVVHIFKNNGYQVHFVHEDDFLLTGGCFVDLCSPGSFLGEFIDILVPNRLQSIPILARVTNRSDGEFMQRVLKHIDLISAQSTPHFMYVHMNSPAHSLTVKQTPDALGIFRKDYFKKIQVANDAITGFAQRILTRDPNALIIINADHGARGFGAYKWFTKEVFEGVSDDLTSLDHLGVLLAIQWPINPPTYVHDIRTNVNLFRYIFSYLSESEDFLATKVPDHGFITKGRGKGSLVLQVVHDGKVLENMVEIGRLVK